MTEGSNKDNSSHYSMLSSTSSSILTVTSCLSLHQCLCVYCVLSKDNGGRGRRELMQINKTKKKKNNERNENVKKKY